MRAQSTLGNSIPVTTRHLESLIRLSQARARLELREVACSDLSLILCQFFFVKIKKSMFKSYESKFNFFVCGNNHEDNQY